jgi:REP element-mobilizing transposase RayT
MSRPPRLKRFVYLGYGRYFVTACTHSRRPVFADTEVGRWLVEELMQMANEDGFAITAYCIRPNHVHLLLEATRDVADLTRFITRWKQRTGFQWKRRHSALLWQEGYFDRVLRDFDDERAVIAYIIGNPVRAGLAETADAYPLAGSSRYSFGQLADAAGDWNPRDGGGWRD